MSHDRDLISGESLGMPGKWFRIRKSDSREGELILTEARVEGLKASQRLFAAIHEVCGYAPESLRTDHYWERDLGIDRIKRRRISAVLGVEFAEVSELQSLRDWALRLSGEEEQSEQAIPTSPSAARNDEESCEAPPANFDEAIEIILQVVQAKTGYERSLLDLDADLEADLGIDTIKQVQVLGQLRRRFRLQLPEGIRIKDFPTLRHWGNFLLEQSVRGSHLRQETSLAREINGLEAVAAVPNLEVDELEVLAIAQALSAGLPIVELSSSKLIYLASLARGRDDEEDHRDKVQSLLDLIQDRRASLKTLVLLTGRGGDFGDSDSTKSLVRATDGGISGFARTMSKEFPEIQVRLVDLSPDEVREDPQFCARGVLLSLGMGLETGITKTTLHQPTIKSSFLNFETDPQIVLDSSSVVAIFGGTQGVGAEIARDLVARYGMRVVVLGRREPDPTSPWMQLRCDVTRFDEVQAALKEIVARFGRIDGVVHAAGLIEDRRIEQKTAESFARVYSVKVDGMRNLVRATRELPLRFLVAFGSVSGRFGNEGQCDYSAANAALVEMSARARLDQPERRTFVISWGAIDEVGMAARSGVADLLRAGGAGVIPIQEALRAFHDELIYGGHFSEIILRPLPRASLERGDERVIEKDLSRETLPWIADHRIGGLEVVPATYGVALMLEASAGLLPEWKAIEVSGLRIHFPLQIDSTSGISVRVRARVHASTVRDRREVHCSIMLQSDEARAYECVIVYAKETSEPSAHLGALMTAARSSLSCDQIYQSPSPKIPLGPSFHVLSHFDSLDDGFALGRVGDDREAVLGFLPPGLRAVEAAFHVASLLSSEGQAGALIPKRFDTWSEARERSETEALRILAKRIGDCRFDFQFIDSEGLLRAELRGYEALPMEVRNS